MSIGFLVQARPREREIISPVEAGMKSAVLVVSHPLSSIEENEVEKDLGFVPRGYSVSLFSLFTQQMWTSERAE